MSAVSKLFSPKRVGDVTLAHRIVLAPMTRFRANKAHIHNDLAVEYYAQRARAPGTLLITEATYIAAKAGGVDNVPGIWSDEQIASWKKVADAVHAQGSFIYMQIWGLGRAANPASLKAEDPSFEYVSSSPVKHPDKTEVPRALTIAEIKEYSQLFAAAAVNAVQKAGLDGVEIHGAHGYLVDQFNQDVVNQRTDEYGGSVENRTRFALEVIDAVAKAIGPTKTAIRLSPWSTYSGMGMKDPLPTFTYLVTQLRERFPDLAYLHFSEPDAALLPADTSVGPSPSNDFARELWGDRPFLVTGSFTPDSANDHADKTGDLIGFARHFLANPDLPLRVKDGLTLNPYNRETFYTPESAVGYTDYPFATAEEVAVKA